jgi:hypothetical protein
MILVLHASLVDLIVSNSIPGCEVEDIILIGRKNQETKNFHRCIFGHEQCSPTMCPSVARQDPIWQHNQKHIIRRRRTHVLSLYFKNC